MKFNGWRDDLQGLFPCNAHSSKKVSRPVWLIQYSVPRRLLSFLIYKTVNNISFTPTMGDVLKKGIILEYFLYQKDPIILLENYEYVFSLCTIIISVHEFGNISWK